MPTVVPDALGPIDWSTVQSVARARGCVSKRLKNFGARTSELDGCVTFFLLSLFRKCRGDGMRSNATAVGGTTAPLRTQLHAARGQRKKADEKRAAAARRVVLFVGSVRRRPACHRR